MVISPVDLKVMRQSTDRETFGCPQYRTTYRAKSSDLDRDAFRLNRLPLGSL